MSEDKGLLQRSSGKRLGLGRQLVYAGGNFGVALMPVAAAFLGYYYHGRESDSGQPIVLVSTLTFGVIWFAGNALNAVTDPLVGFLSDRTRSRLGRRRPWVILGAPFLALCFFFMWVPATDTPSTANSLILFVSLLGFWFFYTVVVAPYMSMLPDITPYDNERMRLSVFMGVFGDVLGTAAGNLLMVFVGLSAIAGGFWFLRNGWEVMALLFALAGMLLFLLSAALTREVYTPPVTEAATGGESTLRRAFGAFVSVFGNPAFRPYVVGVFFYRMAIITITFSSLFIATKILGSYPLSEADRAFLGLLGTLGEDGKPNWEQAASYLMMLVMVGALLQFPLVDRLAAKTGKRKLFVLALTWLGVILVLMASLGAWPLLTPFYSAVVLFVLASFPVAVGMVLPRALLADVIDADEKMTGQRREGLYNGMEGFMMKMAAGLGPLFAEILFAAFGATRTDNLGVRLCGPVAGICLLAAAWAFSRYPIRK